MYSEFKTVDVCGKLSLRKHGVLAVIFSGNRMIDSGGEYIVGRHWLNYKAIAMKGA